MKSLNAKLSIGHTKSLQKVKTDRLLGLASKEGARELVESIKFEALASSESFIGEFKSITGVSPKDLVNSSNPDAGLVLILSTELSNLRRKMKPHRDFILYRPHKDRDAEVFAQCPSSDVDDVVLIKNYLKTDKAAYFFSVSGEKVHNFLPKSQLLQKVG